MNEKDFTKALDGLREAYWKLVEANRLIDEKVLTDNQKETMKVEINDFQSYINDIMMDLGTGD